MDNSLGAIPENKENVTDYNRYPLYDVAMGNVNIFWVCGESASENIRQSIERVALMVGEFFDRKLMRHAIAAMLEKSKPGEPEGNCHNIALAFMTDLIISGLAQDWYWVQGHNPKILRQDKPWEHSWLEHDGVAVDASIGTDMPSIVIGEAGQYYKERHVEKILSRRNARQTRKFISRMARNERTIEC